MTYYEIQNRLSSRIVKLLIVILLATVCSSKIEASEMNIFVDATELPRKLIHSTIEMNLSGDTARLLYPKWIPGIHGPKGPVENIGSLIITDSDGIPVKWERDWTEVYRFFVYPQEINAPHIVSLTYICNQNSVNSKGIDSYGSNNLGVINWNTVVVYPEGVNVRDIRVNLKVILPPDWKYGSALPYDKTNGDTIIFKPVSFEEFIDMPLITAVNMKTIQLTKTDRAEYFIHIAAHDENDLDVDDSVLVPLTNLPYEAEKLFSRPHFEQYHFLLYLSDIIPGTGLEHRNSSLNGVGAKGLKEMGEGDTRLRYLLPHEFVHAWVGKYRRPAGMNTPDYMADKNTDMLWIYEGLTQYLGHVLSCRSGLITVDQLIESWTYGWGTYHYKKGRSWRPLRDTQVAAYTLRGGSKSWSLLRRSQDYYGEGAYHWLGFDARIREDSQGKKSLDDFCAAIFGSGHVDSLTNPLTMDEIYSTLNNLASLPWDSLIADKIDSTHEAFNAESFTLCGYRFDYKNEKSEYLKKREKKYKYKNLYESLGLSINKDNRIDDIVPGGLADKVGLYSGVEIIAVNGRKYSHDRLIKAIENSPDNPKINLLTFTGDDAREFVIEYDGGLRYFTLVPIEGQEDWLRKIIAPLEEK